jgi:hypothetical protein
VRAATASAWSVASPGSSALAIIVNGTWRVANTRTAVAVAATPPAVNLRTPLACVLTLPISTLLGAAARLPS